MNNPFKIDIANDFSTYPAGRTKADGDNHGEKFRSQLLVPALKRIEAGEAKSVEVLFDGARSYGSSFLEEAFGGLVRIEGFSKDFLNEHLKLQANSKTYRIYTDLARKYIDRA